MRILFITSEVAPYSKTGGLADVSSALPAALRHAGHDVLTITPRYRAIPLRRLEPVTTLTLQQTPLADRAFEWSAYRHEDVLFVELPELFDRAGIYSDEPDEHLRFAAFSHAALDAARLLDWRPDVIHCNDWQTGLIPALMRIPDVSLAGTPTVMTVHNLGYQGRFGSQTIGELGITGHEHLLHQDHLEDGYLSFLETGLIHADLVTTVSPTYAREILTPDGGAGLDGLLERRSDSVIGILNGIDTMVWNPRTDSLIPFHYSDKSLWRKEWDKRALCGRLDLDYRKGVPVLGMISRLVYQKGIEIMPAPLVYFLDTWDLRLVVLGDGEQEYESFFAGLARMNPERVAFVKGYDEELSHLIEAGSDIFLMPSLYEPCGLNQMYSLAYGTLPVVRKVGGLADTVEPIDDETGTGFVFEHFTPDGLGWAIGQALTLHLDQPAWKQAQMRAMAIDNSWEHRAGDYETAYRRAMTERMEAGG